LGVVGVLILAGCASLNVPMASAQGSATAKEFDSVPDRGVVYIVRTDSGIRSIAGAAPQILADGKFVATMPQETFVRITLRPGDHTVSVLATAFPKTDQPLDVRAGRVYFIESDILMGAIRGSILLRRIDDVRGKSLVLRSSMVAAEWSGE
jgi:hypothetical protein